MTTSDMLVLNDSYTLQSETVSIKDIIGQQNEIYMNFILLSSTILLFYVLWTNFLINSKYQKWMESKDIDIHELAILPTLVLVITTLAYKGMI